MDRSKKTETAISWKTGLQNFYGDEDLYKHYVFSFDDCSLKQILPNILEGMVLKNWSLVSEEAHGLQSASRYLSAGPVSEASLQLEKISAELIDTNGMTSGAIQAKEAEIGITYLQLISEIVFLKQRLAAETKKPVDLSQIEHYRSYNKIDPSTYQNKQQFIPKASKTKLPSQQEIPKFQIKTNSKTFENSGYQDRKFYCCLGVKDSNRPTQQGTIEPIANRQHDAKQNNSKGSINEIVLQECAKDTNKYKPNPRTESKTEAETELVVVKQPEHKLMHELKVVQQGEIQIDVTKPTRVNATCCNCKIF